MELSRSATIKLSGRERSRWPTLARMLASGELTADPPRNLTQREKLSRWMVNEGYRKVFVGVFIALHGMVFAFGFMNYWLKDNLTNARDIFGVTYAIGRAAALVLHVDVALILFPVCRTLISLARQTPLNGIIQFDKNITFHKLVGMSLFIFSWIHTIAHGVNFGQFAAKNDLGAAGFFLLSFQSGPGWSGYAMLIALTAMVATSLEKPRRANYERFWNVHHLFIIFFVFFSVHGAFCMIKPDFEPFCAEAGNFWMYWIAGAVIYLFERVAREWRGRHRTTITKVVQHPSNVVEVQIRKENTKTRAGQYVFLCCPEVSLWQYHPFTLTSAPEEDYLSVHVRCVGDFTKSFARALGCDFDRKKTEKGVGQAVVRSVGVGEKDTDPSLQKLLPRIFLDGPFGSASEDVFKFEVALLVGGGIGVTPFASILKSIWYRMNYPRGNSKLKKVYFFWVCRDIAAFEWFRSLLLAVEAQDKDEQIEIHTYLTAKVRPDDATNIMINDANSEVDSITGLRAPTNFGRPNWDAVFKGIRKIHHPAEAGVFFCGPKPLASQLHLKCNMYSEPGFNFVWGKECF